jgi:hypothetical protein
LKAFVVAEQSQPCVAYRLPVQGLLPRGFQILQSSVQQLVLQSTAAIGCADFLSSRQDGCELRLLSGLDFHNEAAVAFHEQIGGRQFIVQGDSNATGECHFSDSDGEPTFA